MFFTASESTAPEAAGAARRHGTAWRPKAWPGGRRHGLAANGNGLRPRANGLRPDALPGERATPAENRTPQSRSRTKAQRRWQFMHRNQVSRQRLDRAAGVRGPAAHVAALALALALVSGLWLLLRPWLLSLAPALASALLGNRVAPRGPRHRAAGLGQGRDMGRPYGLRPMGLGPVILGTHYASLRVCPAPMLARV